MAVSILTDNLSPTRLSGGLFKFDFESDLPKCPEYRHPVKSPWNNCFGTHNYSSSGTYTGEFKNNKRHGIGYFDEGNGSKHWGEYKDDKLNGRGFSINPNGSTYWGEYKNGKMHGRGTYTFPDGTRRIGTFKNNYFGDTRTFPPIRVAKTPTPVAKTPTPVAKTPTPVAKAPAPAAERPNKDDELNPASSGSGFAVSSDGYVITNHHVIEGCQKVVVHMKGKGVPVTVVTYDTQNDLALLKGNFRPETVFPLSKNSPELLQDIYVAGYPFGNKFSTSIKVTKGIISSLTGIGNNFSNIQIDAALQSGNSGGPILDDFGNVVGVAVSKLDAKYMFDNYGSIPENTNFGIKSTVVRSVLDSNEVDNPSANQVAVSKSNLGKMIDKGTYYISCWMTIARIKEMKNRKVFFTDLN